MAAGTQIAVDDTPNFVATLEVYDAANSLLQTFSLPGMSSTIIDNSALFLGVRSETANISRLVYYTNISNRAIGINAVSIAIVPEPSATLGLLVLSAIAILSSHKSKIQ